MRRILFAWVLAVACVAGTAIRAAETMPIDKAAKATDGQIVKVEGDVSAFRASWSDKAPNLITLKDATGEIAVAVWPDIFGKLTPAPAVGSHVVAMGKMSPFRGAPQIRVEDAAGLTVSAAGAKPAEPAATPSVPAAPSEAAATAEPIAPAPAAEPAAAPEPASGAAAIGSLNEGMVKQEKTVQGEVTDFRPSRGDKVPNTFTVKDSSGSIAVVIWPEAFNALQEKPVVGSRLRATGEIAKYRDTLQLKVTKADNMTLVKGSAIMSGAAPAASAGSRLPSEGPVTLKPVEPKATPEATPEQTPEPTPSTPPGGKVSIKDITSEMSESEVTISGKITQLKPSWGEKAPNILEVQDGTGRFTVLIYPDVFTTIDPEPTVGMKMTAKGKVGKFRGMQQITVLSTGSVQVESEAPAAPAQ